MTADRCPLARVRSLAREAAAAAAADRTAATAVAAGPLTDAERHALASCSDKLLDAIDRVLRILPADPAPLPPLASGAHSHF